MKSAVPAADTTQRVEVVKLAIHAKHIQQEFKEFITGLDPRHIHEIPHAELLH